MLTARALTPIEQVIGSWDRITHARMAHDNLKQFLADGETPADTVRLPDPTGQISVQGAGLQSFRWFQCQADPRRDQLRARSG